MNAQEVESVVQSPDVTCCVLEERERIRTDQHRHPSIAVSRADLRATEVGVGLAQVRIDVKVVARAVDVLVARVERSLSARSLD